ncbi:hypothetical protein [Streptomyces sp. LN704]|uniref:hypothetical protein n=1 Tax=Streptomyces sp. LN704 TaxID=3112982 RepID=UPI00371B7080
MLGERRQFGAGALPGDPGGTAQDGRGPVGRADANPGEDQLPRPVSVAAEEPRPFMNAIFRTRVTSRRRPFISSRRPPAVGSSTAHGRQDRCRFTNSASKSGDKANKLAFLAAFAA